MKKYCLLLVAMLCLPRVFAYTLDTLPQCLCLTDSGRHAYVYHGIPYAHADRLQPPVLLPWDSTCTYIHLGHACPQNARQPGLVFSEDCLVLTINSPVPVSRIPHADYPVLVHIHGGSFQQGTGENWYTQLGEFTLSEQIVTVTISYRLGAFGYLYLPDLGSINLGMQDQLLALEWVKRYIPLWGGDPNRLCLSGQSAGAQAVVDILAQKNRPYIHKALILSAPLGIRQSASVATKRTRLFMQQLHGQDPLTCPADSLLAAARRYEEKVHAMGMQWMPTVSKVRSVGKTEVLNPMDTLSRSFPATPILPAEVIVTCQADDASYFLYPNWALEPIATSYAFTVPSKRYVRYLRQRGVQAYYHLFTWQPRGNKYRAQHCAELPLFIGELKRWDRGWCLGDVTWQELQPLRADFSHRLAEWIRR